MSDGNGQIQAAEALPKLRPEPEDDRYDLRLKRRLAQDCVKMADAGMYEHALVALWEMGMARKVDGTAITAIEPRTKVQALAAFTRSMHLIAPSDSAQTVNVDARQQVALQIPDAWLKDPRLRDAALTLTERVIGGEKTNGQE